MVVSTFRSRRRYQRIAAATGGLLLLFAQLLGAAHSHRYQFEPSLSATGQARADESGPCPVCLSTFHAPLAVASPSTIVRPQSVVVRAVEQGTPPCSSLAISSPNGRGPPASV